MITNKYANADKNELAERLDTIGTARDGRVSASVFRDTKHYNRYILLPRGADDAYVIRAAKYGTAMDILNILRDERDDAADKADRWSLNPRVEQSEIDYFKNRAHVYGSLLDDMRDYINNISK